MDNKTQCLNSDSISALPRNIIEYILCFMPLRDALRTSILSQKWRYRWRSMPKVVFKNDMFKVPKGSSFRQLKYKYVSAIFHVLMLHNGPTELVFGCSFGKLDMMSEFEQILSYLAKGNKVKDLRFYNDSRSYKLPVSFFSLQGLEHMYLESCTFEPPLTFNICSCLRSMTFLKVEVSAQMLQRFLSQCPMLEYIALNGCQTRVEFVAEGNKFTFVDLLLCVPLVKTLGVSRYYMKFLSAGDVPHKLPASLDHLKILCLDVCLMEPNEISSALCVIRSSPVLEKIIFVMHDKEKLPAQQTSDNFLDLEDCANVDLDHLEIFEIKMFSSNLPLAMDLVKLVMAKSPMLKKVQLDLKDKYVSVDEEVKMLRDLVRIQVPRASPSAKLIIVRPTTS